MDCRLEPSLPRLARGTASVGLGFPIEARPFSLTSDPGWRPMSTATDRAAEALEAAERMYADETGATLNLSPATKVALIATITAAIQAAVAEETQKLTWVV